MSNWTQDTMDDLVEYIALQDPHAYMNIFEVVKEFMNEEGLDMADAGVQEIAVEAAYHCGRAGIFAVDEWN